MSLFVIRIGIPLAQHAIASPLPGVEAKLRETFPFLMLTGEAAVPVALSERPAAARHSSQDETTHG